MDEEGVVEEVVDVLSRGGVVLFPTDTLYGLLANIEDRKALEKLVEIKGREKGKPFPVFVDSVEKARKYAALEEEALRLWKRFMPGGLTLVVPARISIPFVTSDEKAIGLRVPNHPVLLEVLKRLGFGVTGTSANVSGDPPPKSFDKVSKEILSAVDLAVKERGVLKGVASTVVKLERGGAFLIREGCIPFQEIEDELRRKDPAF